LSRAFFWGFLNFRTRPRNRPRRGWPEGWPPNH
jgi:hypothetical protein